MFGCKQALVVFVAILVTTGKKLKEFSVDLGRNLTIPCPLPISSVVWYHHESIASNETAPSQIKTPQDDGSLLLLQAGPSEAGIYTCTPEGHEEISASVRVRVRTPPPALNVKVHSTTILALLMWSIEGTGGYPIVYFTAEFRPADADQRWEPISPDKIAPTVRQIEVFKLKTNTTYTFRMWATNRLGRGEIAEVEGHTRQNNQRLELEKFFMHSARVFDKQMLVIAVIVIVATIVCLSLGTCYLFYQEGTFTESRHIIDMMPHIILNPGFVGNVVDPDVVDEITPWLGSQQDLFLD